MNAFLPWALLALLCIVLVLLWLLWRRSDRYVPLTDMVPGLEPEDPEDPEVAENEALIEKWQREDFGSCIADPSDLHVVDGVYCLDHCSPKAGYRLAVRRRNMTAPKCRACLIHSLL